MFEVGDEVVCVDDSAEPFGEVGLRKGEVFIVCDVFRPGETFGNYNIISFGIAIGRKCQLLERHARIMGLYVPHYDIWAADRFRKVERKRSREELYALIGIDGMVDQRVPEAA